MKNETLNLVITGLRTEENKLSNTNAVQDANIMVFEFACYTLDEVHGQFVVEFAKELKQKDLPNKAQLMDLFVHRSFVHKLTEEGSVGDALDSSLVEKFQGFYDKHIQNTAGASDWLYYYYAQILCEIKLQACLACLSGLNKVDFESSQQTDLVFDDSVTAKLEETITKFFPEDDTQVSAEEMANPVDGVIRATKFRFAGYLLDFVGQLKKNKSISASSVAAVYLKHPWADFVATYKIFARVFHGTVFGLPRLLTGWSTGETTAQTSSSATTNAPDQDTANESAKELHFATQVSGEPIKLQDIRRSFEESECPNNAWDDVRQGTHDTILKCTEKSNQSADESDDETETTRSRSRKNNKKNDSAAPKPPPRRRNNRSNRQRKRVIVSTDEESSDVDDDATEAASQNSASEVYVFIPKKYQVAQEKQMRRNGAHQRTGRSSGRALDRSLKVLEQRVEEVGGDPLRSLLNPREPQSKRKTKAKRSTRRLDQSRSTATKVVFDSQFSEDDDDDDESDENTSLANKMWRMNSFPSQVSPLRKKSRGSRPSRRAKAAPASGKRTRRVPYSEEEEEFVLEGVEKFGEGQWAKILKAYPFHKTRKSLDIRDKYRNLLKKAQ